MGRVNKLSIILPVLHSLLKLSRQLSARQFLLYVTNCVYFGFSCASVTTRNDSSLISAACSLATYRARVDHHALLGRHEISAEVSVTPSYLLTIKLDKHCSLYNVLATQQFVRLVLELKESMQLFELLRFWSNAFNGVICFHLN